MPAFSVIQEVKAVDERTVTITIAQRDLEFISYLTSAIIPKGYDDQATHPVGTGPFMYVSQAPRRRTSSSSALTITGGPPPIWIR